MMKSMIIAGIMALGAMGTASAAGFPGGAVLHMDTDVTDRDAATITQAAWIGRYGQICEHGPVWQSACHATNAPTTYVPGHWSPMMPAWIPGRYH